jgi:hypothetical protein
MKRNIPSRPPSSLVTEGFVDAIENRRCVARSVWRQPKYGEETAVLSRCVVLNAVGYPAATAGQGSGRSIEIHSWHFAEGNSFSVSLETSLSQVAARLANPRVSLQTHPANAKDFPYFGGNRKCKHNMMC